MTSMGGVTRHAVQSLVRSIVVNMTRSGASPMAVNSTIMCGLNRAKSAMGSMFTFQTNQAVATSISPIPS